MSAIPLPSSSDIQLSGEFGFLISRLEEARKSYVSAGHGIERYLRMIIERLRGFTELIEPFVGEVNQLRIMCSSDLVSHPEPRISLALQQYFREVLAVCEQTQPPSSLNLADAMRRLRYKLMNEMSSSQIQGLFSNNLLKASGTLYIVEKMIYDNQNMLAPLLPNLICVAQLMTRFIRVPDPLMLELAEFLQLMNETIPEYGLDRATFDEYIGNLAIACHNYVCQNSQSAALDLARRMNGLRMGIGRGALLRQAAEDAGENKNETSAKQNKKLSRKQAKALKMNRPNSATHALGKDTQGQRRVRTKRTAPVQNDPHAAKPVANSLAKLQAKRKAKASRANQSTSGITQGSSSPVFHGLPPKPAGLVNEHSRAPSTSNYHSLPNRQSNPS